MTNCPLKSPRSSRLARAGFKSIRRIRPSALIPFRGCLIGSAVPCREPHGERNKLTKYTSLLAQ